MYKSAYKFGLCLMASLIVLSALAIPMGSMNNFQDAMASGKHSDRYDNSQEYDKSYYSAMIINTHQIIIIIMNL